MKTANLKEKALKKLKGNYVVIICALIIFSFVDCIFAGTSKLIYNENMNILFSLLVVGLLYMGLMDIVIKIAKGKKVEIKDLFNKTDMFWKTVAVTIVILAITTVCFLLEGVALNSLRVFTTFQTDLNSILASIMILIGVLLCVAIAAFYVIIMMSFAQVYFILYENENMPVIDIFSRSMDLMENHKVDYVIFNLSFIGWMFLGLFTCGLLYLWLTPYMLVANYYFYDSLKKLDKQK